jgi:hypothetical protein
LKIRFLGAARTVTGSCFHLISNGLQVLVDCGMYQGKNSDEINKLPFPFDPEKIDYLLLTHAHLDHSGLIPKLVASGFRGRIITTTATADLVEIMLYDSAHIQEKDAEWLTKKSFRAGKDEVFEPLYTSEDVAASIPFFDRKTYRVIESLGDGTSNTGLLTPAISLAPEVSSSGFKALVGKRKSSFPAMWGKMRTPSLTTRNMLQKLTMYWSNLPMATAFTRAWTRASMKWSTQ